MAVLYAKMSKNRAYRTLTTLCKLLSYSNGNSSRCGTFFREKWVLEPQLEHFGDIKSILIHQGDIFRCTRTFYFSEMSFYGYFTVNYI